jgi:hypothetical protein
MALEHKGEGRGMFPAQIVEDIFLHVQKRKKLYLARLRDRQVQELLQGTYQYDFDNLDQCFFTTLEKRNVIMDAAS